MRNLLAITGTILTLTIWLGCNYKPGDPIRWDPEYLVPIAHSEVGITDLISDSTLVNIQSDKSVSVIYRDTLNESRLFDLVEIPDTTIERRFDLSTFTLAPQTIVQKITLGQLARTLQAQGNFVGDLILLSHGGFLPSVAPQTGIQSGAVVIDASDLFEFADLTQGNMFVEIENQLPLGLNNVNLSLKNQTLAGFETQIFFPSIPSGQKASDVRDLTDNQIESDLLAELTNVDIAGSNTPVPVDTNDFLQITIVASGLKARKAIAIFPDQTVADNSETIIYDFGEDYQDVALTKAVLKQGRIIAEINSTIEDTISVRYTLTNFYKNGESPVITRKIPPAPPQGTSKITEIFELDGYEMDMDINGEPNTLIQAYTIDLVYSGNLVNIDLQDSVFAQFQLVDIEPSYIEGFFGRQTQRITGEGEVDIFRDAVISGLSLREAKSRVLIENSIGMDLELDIRQIQTSNLTSSQSRNLSSPVFASPIDVPGPSISEIGSIKTATLDLDENNSNILDLINIVPNYVSYEMDLAYNQQRGLPFLENFATETSGVTSIMELEVPLYGSVESVCLLDTVDASFQLEDIQRVESGTLRLIIDNGFPFSAELYATLLDENGQEVDQLFDGDIIQAASVNANGVSETVVKSTLEKPFTQSSLQKILRDSRRIAIKYIVNTNDKTVRLYDDYRIGAKLVGQFIYTL